MFYVCYKCEGIISVVLREGNAPPASLKNASKYFTATVLHCFIFIYNPGFFLIL